MSGAEIGTGSEGERLPYSPAKEAAKLDGKKGWRSGFLWQNGRGRAFRRHGGLLCLWEFRLCGIVVP